MKKITAVLKKNWFIIGIFSAVIAGYYFPVLSSSLNRGGYFSSFLVILLFFIQGLILPAEKLIKGVKNTKLHIYIQAVIFIVYPLFFYIAVTMLPFNFSEEIKAGLFALACLPTTVSSCTVFTGMAGGNISGAIFNAALANMAGVFITPLLFSFMLGRSTLALPITMLIEVLISLVIRILVPMAAGQFVRRFFSEYIDSKRKKLSIASNVSILMILLFAFSGSSGAINIELFMKVYPVLIFLAVSYIVITYGIYRFAVIFKFGSEDIITSVFAGSQKTLAMGAPLITLYFMDNPKILGIVLIPLLFYHPWQLIVSSFIVDHFLKKKG